MKYSKNNPVPVCSVFSLFAFLLPSSACVPLFLPLPSPSVNSSPLPSASLCDHSLKTSLAEQGRMGSGFWETHPPIIPHCPARLLYCSTARTHLRKLTCARQHSSWKSGERFRVAWRVEMLFSVLRAAVDKVSCVPVYIYLHTRKPVIKRIQVMVGDWWKQVYVCKHTLILLSLVQLFLVFLGSRKQKLYF